MLDIGRNGNVQQKLCRRGVRKGDRPELGREPTSQYGASPWDASCINPKCWTLAGMLTCSKNCAGGGYERVTFPKWEGYKATTHACLRRLPHGSAHRGRRIAAAKASAHSRPPDPGRY